MAARLTKASAGRRAEFERKIDAVRKLRAQGSVSYDELWETVAEIVESSLYLAVGLKTVKEFIAKELPGENERSVQRNILVARTFSPRDEAEHGISKLEEVANYAKELTGAEETPRAIDLDRFRIAVRKNGKALNVPASQATVQEIRGARAALRRQRAGKKPVDPLEEALHRALSKSRIAGVTLRVRSNSVAFSGVPVGKLPEFARAIASAKVPADH